MTSTAANALLDEAGYTRGADGTRTMPDGSPFAFDISVGATSSDWLSVANIIDQNLDDVGIEGTVNAPDWSAVVAGYEDGSFDTGIVWSNMEPTPYQFYRGVMSTETVKPVGEQATQNYHRFGLPEADALLGAVRGVHRRERASGRRSTSCRSSSTRTRRSSRCSPARGGARTTRRASPASRPRTNPYATLSTRGPTTVLVLTTLEPVVSE